MKPEIVLAIEYGYRACEKGQTLMQAIEALSASCDKAINDEFQKIFWTPEALRAKSRPVPCPNCGKIESPNLTCTNHIILMDFSWTE